jgi:hypothetical protein
VFSITLLFLPLFVCGLACFILSHLIIPKKPKIVRSEPTKHNKVMCRLIELGTGLYSMNTSRFGRLLRPSKRAIEAARTKETLAELGLPTDESIQRGERDDRKRVRSYLSRLADATGSVTSHLTSMLKRRQKLKTQVEELNASKPDHFLQQDLKEPDISGFRKDLRVPPRTCCVCDRKDSDTQDFAFDEGSLLFTNFIKHCRAENYRGEALHPHVIDHYSLQNKTSHPVLVSAFKNVLVSPRGIIGGVLFEADDLSVGSADIAAAVSVAELNATYESLQDTVDWTHAHDQDTVVHVAQLDPEDEISLEPRFIFCNDCKSHLSKYGCESYPRFAIVDGQAFAELPREISRKMNDTMQMALAQHVGSIRMKKIFKGVEGQKRWCGHTSFFDLPNSIAEVAQRGDIRFESRMFQISICKGFSEDTKQEIRRTERVLVQDFTRAAQWYRRNNPIYKDNAAFDAQELIITHHVAKDGEIDVVVETDVEPPTEHSGVIGSVYADGANVVRLYAGSHTMGAEMQRNAAQFVTGTDTVELHVSSWARMHEPDFLLKLLPGTIPYGNVSAPPGVSFEMWAKSLLRLSGGQFSANPLFLYGLFNYINFQKIRTSIYLSMKNKNATRFRGILGLTRAQLLAGAKSIVDRIEGGIRVQCGNKGNLIVDPVAKATSSIHGSDGERFKIRGQLQALAYVHGRPTHFVTISPPTHANGPLACSLDAGRSVRIFDANGNLLPLPDKLPSVEKNRKLAQEDPAGCADFSHRLFHSFITRFLGWDVENRCSLAGGGILGECDYVYGTVETNGRGVLHCHLLLRVKGTPRTRREFTETLSNNAEFARKTEEYISRTTVTAYTELDIRCASCPSCGSAGSLQALEPLGKGYLTQSSRLLPAPVTVKCLECGIDSTSGDTIRNSAMFTLLPLATRMRIDDRKASTIKTGPIWPKDSVKAFVENVLLCNDDQGVHLRDIERLTNITLQQVNAFNNLLRNYFQEHLESHTTTCFKLFAMCRMGYPRDLVKATCIGADGQLVIERHVLAEYLNFTLPFVLEHFRCNSDVNPLLSGDALSALLIRYVTKYTSKPQDNIDIRTVREIVVRAAENAQDRLLTLTEDEEDIRALWLRIKNFYISITAAITNCNEIDPQLAAWCVKFGDPVVGDFPFKTLSLLKYFNLIAGEMPPSVLKPVTDGVWEQGVDSHFNYLHRPRADESHCLLVHTMTRVLHYAAPREEQETFTEGHPAINDRSLLPSPELAVIVVKPDLPNIIYDDCTPTSVRDHFNCTKGRCQAILRPSVCSIMSISHFRQILGQSLFDEPLYIDPYEQDGVPDDSSSNFSLESELDPEDGPMYYDNDEFDGNWAPIDLDSSKQERWGKQICLLMSSYRQMSDLRCCPHENWFEAGNRVLFKLLSKVACGLAEPETELVVQMFFNSNDAQIDPELQRRSRARDRERDLEAKKHLSSLDASGWHRHEQGDVDQAPASQASHDALLDNPEAMIIALEALSEGIDEHRAISGSRMIQSAKSLAKTIATNATSRSVFAALDESQMYKTRNSTAHPLSNVPSVPGIAEPRQAVIRHLGPVNVLKNISDRFNLVYEQRIAFYVIGSRLARLLNEDFDEPLPIDTSVVVAQQMRRPRWYRQISRHHSLAGPCTVLCTTRRHSHCFVRWNRRDFGGRDDHSFNPRA